MEITVAPAFDWSTASEMPFPGPSRYGSCIRAIRLVFQYAKAAGVKTVRAVVAEDNPASLGLVRALGYVKSEDTVRGGRQFTTFRVVL